MTDRPRNPQRYLTAGYLPAIGIECHVQLAAKTKLFTAVANEPGLSAAPNVRVGPLCLGLPGALPVVNEEAVRLGIWAGLALGAEINGETGFDRKHYFYPDLPLGYQITQHYRPLVGAGRLEIPLSETESFVVRVQRAHLEADAGKLTHRPGEDFSLVDLNRVGAPLLEIVSEPDMRSPAQAKRYAKELYLRMIHAGVCSGDLFAGNLRFDVNVSVSKTPGELGTRTETKNLNSFRFVERAVEHEIARQIEVLEAGGRVIQETRGWDEVSKRTFPQRSKEDAQDYRYMPDPDIPPLAVSAEQVERERAALPPTVPQIRRRLAAWRIPFRTAETVLDHPEAAGLLCGLPPGLGADAAKFVVNWLVGDILALIKQGKTDWSRILDAGPALSELAEMRRSGKIGSQAAKDWLPKLILEGAPPASLLDAAGQGVIADAAALKAVIAEVFEANPKAVADAKADRKAAGFLIGQTMKACGGRADPKLAAALVDELLGGRAES